MNRCEKLIERFSNLDEKGPEDFIHYYMTSQLDKADVDLLDSVEIKNTEKDKSKIKKSHAILKTMNKELKTYTSFGLMHLEKAIEKYRNTKIK